MDHPTKSSHHLRWLKIWNLLLFVRFHFSLLCSFSFSFSFSFLKDWVIKQISCGRYFTVALAEGSPPQVFSWGTNDHVCRFLHLFTHFICCFCFLVIEKGGNRIKIDHNNNKNHSLFLNLLIIIFFKRGNWDKGINPNQMTQLHLLILSHSLMFSFFYSFFFFFHSTFF